MKFSVKWMDLGIIILSEVAQTQKDKCSMFNTWTDNIMSSYVHNYSMFSYMDQSRMFSYMNSYSMFSYMDSYSVFSYKYRYSMFSYVDLRCSK